MNCRKINQKSLSELIAHENKKWEIEYISHIINKQPMNVFWISYLAYKECMILSSIHYLGHKGRTSTSPKEAVDTDCFFHIISFLLKFPIFLKNKWSLCFKKSYKDYKILRIGWQSVHCTPEFDLTKKCMNNSTSENLSGHLPKWQAEKTYMLIPEDSEKAFYKSSIYLFILKVNC